MATRKKLAGALVSSLVAVCLAAGCLGGPDKAEIEKYARPFKDLQPKVRKVIIGFVQVSQSPDEKVGLRRLREEILPAAQEILTQVKAMSPPEGKLEKGHKDLVQCWTDRVVGYQQEIKRLEGDKALIGASPRTFVKSDMEAAKWWDKVIEVLLEANLADNEAFKPLKQSLEFMGKQTQSRDDISFTG